MARRNDLQWALREARLITKELRLLGVPSQVIGKIWLAIVAIAALLFIILLVYLAVHH